MKNIIFICDIDGCLTDGRFTYTANGKISKQFGPHDNDGIKLLKKNNITIQFITADKRGYKISQSRINDMDCNIVLISECDRYEYIKHKKTLFDYIIFMGDGIYDIDCMKISNFSIAPINALQQVKKQAIYVTKSGGGDGAVYEAAKFIIYNIINKEKNNLHDIIQDIIYTTKNQLLNNDYNNIEQIICKIFNSRKIVGVGAGRVGYSLRGFIMRLNHLGLNATFIGDTNVPKLTHEDTLLVASSTGTTRTIVYYAKIAKEAQKCSVISFTTDKNNQLTKYSDYVMPIRFEKNNYIMKTIPQLMYHILFDSIIEYMIIYFNLSTQQITNNHSMLE